MLKFLTGFEICSQAGGAEAKFSQWQPSAEASCRLFYKIHFARWISFACSKYRPKTGKSKIWNYFSNSEIILISHFKNLAKCGCQNCAPHRKHCKCALHCLSGGLTTLSTRWHRSQRFLQFSMFKSNVFQQNVEYSQQLCGM